VEKKKDDFSSTLKGCGTTLQKGCRNVMVFLTGGAIGVVVPAYSAFTKLLAPPLFPAGTVGAITAGLVGGAVYVTSTFGNRSKDLAKLLRVGISLIVLSLIFLAFYLGLLNYLTVLTPRLERSAFRSASADKTGA
jgi:hypothetical protein